MTYIKKYFAGFSPEVWQGFFASLLNSILSCAFYFLSLYFVVILHLDIAVTGYILALYSIGTMVGGLIGGKLADYFSPRWSSIIGLVIESIGYFFLIFLKNPYLLSINAFFLGCSSYIFMTGNYTMVLHYCQNNEKLKFRALGLMSIMANFGLSFSALLIGYLAHYSFDYVFGVTSILLLLLAVLMFIRKPLSTSLHQKVNPKNSCASQNLFKPELIVTLVCVFLGGSIVTQYSNTHPIYIRETFSTLGIKGVSYLFSLNCLLVVILQSPLVHSIQNQNKLLMSGLGVFLQGLSLFMLNFYTNYSYAMLAILVATIGEVIFFPSVQFLCHNIVSENKKGMGMGLYRTVYGASRAFGAWAGCGVYEKLGASFLWMLTAIIGLICLLLCWIYNALHQNKMLPKADSLHQN